MKKPERHLLIYADGRVEESKDALLGRYFIQHVRTPDGEEWRRTFDVHVACLPDHKNPSEMAAVTVVGLETEYKRLYTAEESRRKDAEHREKLLQSQLRAILHHDDDCKHCASQRHGTGETK